MAHIYLVCVQPKKFWKYNLVLPNSAHEHRPPRVDWYDVLSYLRRVMGNVMPPEFSVLTVSDSCLRELMISTIAGVGK